MIEEYTSEREAGEVDKGRFVATLIEDSPND